ncbi:DNA polymerase I [Salmonella phage S100]|uniref:DNA polymerase I n=2 Tax=Jerseyvirus TaxID=1910991 RepID=A0A2Z5HJI6_9CAUD|nr:DNA polymerase I [Salmonella phage S102]YP_010747639.1 DNA polymerase I [Salmonella phage S100]AXC39715.1 DNA polymerase I [Salmonella phage S103]AXC39780.1 putative DNA polymerase [Salmonella phage S104]AXC41230.1 DNA polymerase I [Salmonella phage S120]AXC41296.1 DNA polymerase I [Salmonella phage S123]AXC42125.1 putative DNA polymerase [Salmonella phage S134]AXC42359.1 DNA polymerase I [Salmonella phage S138]AXC42426.1 putative DNA polymerase [Salmonella phage S142]
MNLLYLDTETFSEADLKKVGSYAYAEHPTTEIVICTYAFDEGPVQVWDATDGSDMPRDLRRAMLKLQKPDSNLKLVGQNFLMFDRPVIKHCWGFELLVENIIDTMIVAFRHALPGSLATLCEVLNIDASMAKDKRGKALIQRFSKPTPKNYKIRRYTADTHPKEWAEFIAYAKSDITSMREVYKKMPKWGNSEFEDRVLQLDQVINDRGFKVDVALAEAAIQAVTRHKEELQEEAQRKYGGSLTGKDFLPILQELAPAHRIHNAQKSTLNDLLADKDLPDDARTIIEMRLGAASTASTKYAPLLLGRSSDDRRRGCLQYGGAKRTLRWAGKGFQPQNLARGYYHDDELDRGIAALLKGRAHRRFDVAKLTASTVRSCIIPEAGRKFVVADYSNVEGRGLAWLAGEETALDTFRAGLDIYCVTAGKMFGMDPDDIKKNFKEIRQIGKACELGLGYEGGVGAFVTFAKNLGLDLIEMAKTMDGTFPDHIWAATARGYEWVRIQEAKRPPHPGEKDDRPSYILDKKVWRTCDAIKRMWRESHPETVAFWRDLKDGILAAVRNPGREFWAGAHLRRNGERAIRIWRTVEFDSSGRKVPGWWLCMELPSGRILSYPGIGVSVTKETDEDGRVNTNVRIKYQGENQLTRQWTTLYTHGGKACENIVQALCRDLLAYAMLNVEAGGYSIVLSVHDELVCETPDTPDYTVAELEKLMCALPEWAEGFPLVAEGAELKRYAK